MKAFKTIVVNLNHEQRVEALVAAAVEVARQTEAHVIGLYVMPPLFMPSDVVMPMGADFYQTQIEEHKAQAARIKTKFENLTAGEPMIAEWRTFGEVRSSYESIADGVVALSRVAELVIVSQANDGQSPPLLSEIPQSVALESGRPVLVIPSSWPETQFGQNITVAWNNSREAARAVFDALPFLERAKSVRLVTAGEGRDAKSGLCVPGAEVAASLARLGINVESETIDEESRHAGAGVLEQCTSNGTDLLVMGAYGHSRMREFILGGMTRHVLANMTLPVLLSH